ncbi:hypothetical protein DV515_00008885 [Chloebia gouldiae]|uniref:Laminin EGF-like domain-containing protein n=1 Tax=Chloebia gouldiae TaxID=44316 RepID=A0A3L8SDR8_CHLGU|nr:hypothetical protein DV515_00008885 [Chloebia gouldiae]
MLLGWSCLPPKQDSGMSSPLTTSPGTCLDCQENTEGKHCELCKEGFYRSTHPAHGCQQCPCSTVASTGTCHLQPGQSVPRCDKCKPGYTGPNCNQCDKGYYNSDSICVRCECNGNVEPALSPRVCRPDSGECIGCLYHTTGTHCELCEEGYSRDPEGTNCTTKGEMNQQVLHSPGKAQVPTGAIQSPKPDQDSGAFKADREDIQRTRVSVFSPRAGGAPAAMGRHSRDSQWCSVAPAKHRSLPGTRLGASCQSSSTAGGSSSSAEPALQSSSWI